MTTLLALLTPALLVADVAVAALLIDGMTKYAAQRERRDAARRALDQTGN
jgi:hypothetical protein